MQKILKEKLRDFPRIRAITFDTTQYPAKRKPKFRKGNFERATFCSKFCRKLCALSPLADLSDSRKKSEETFKRRNFFSFFFWFSLEHLKDEFSQQKNMLPGAHTHTHFKTKRRSIENYFYIVSE